MARIDAAIAERARKQLGLVSARQLDAMGCTRALRRGMVGRGVLQQHSTNVFVVAGAPPTWRRDLLAAVWATGEGAVASHRSAARLWEFHGQHAHALDVTIGHGQRPRSTPARVWRSTDLTATDVTVIGAIPTTTKVRTLIDLAGVVSADVCQDVLDVALRDNAVRREPLQRRACELQRRGRSGPTQLLALLGDDGVTGGRPESWLERRYLEVTRSGGLPAPVTQRVITRNGRTARVDFAYPERGVVIEVYGFRTHSTRRQLAADAARQARLTAAGWHLAYFTYDQVTDDPEFVVARVRELLALPSPTLRPQT